jgi:predicted dinucleotide-binding enzyme
MNKRRLDIVGAGKVGKTLARLWNQNGVFEIGSVANRSLESSEEAIAFIGAGTTRQIDNIDVLMISAVISPALAQEVEVLMIVMREIQLRVTGGGLVRASRH